MIYTVILQNAGLSRKLNKILFVRRRFFINIRKLFENWALAKILELGRSSI